MAARTEAPCQRRCRHVRRRALRWIAEAYSSCRRSRRSAAREHAYMSSRLQALRLKARRYLSGAYSALNVTAPVAQTTRSARTYGTTDRNCPMASCTHKHTGGDGADESQDPEANPRRAHTHADAHTACLGGGDGMLPPHQPRAAARSMQLHYPMGQECSNPRA
jgi:hypothetical protein